MISEKSMVTQNLGTILSEKHNKVPFLNDAVLADALQYLEEKGLPNNKTEDYKYCNLEAVIRKHFQNPGQQFISAANPDAYRKTEYLNLVLINGKFQPGLSDQYELAGIEVKNFEDCDPLQLRSVSKLAHVREDAFAALNTAYCRSGIFIRLHQPFKANKPLRITNLLAADSDAFLNCRNLIVVDETVKAELVFENVYTGTHKFFLNQVSERFIAQEASLNVTELQLRQENLYSVSTIWAELGKTANYDCSTVSCSGELVRNNHNVRLSGEQAAAHLYGLVMAKGQQLIDNHTLMDHRVAHCESNELYKGIGTEKSTVVFNGKIFVQPHAQKTNAYQSSKNILLSDESSIYAKPQLEIYANDVKCSHGTSTGKMDEEALFYLKARGIGEENAKKLLLQAFAAEVLDHLPGDLLKQELELILEDTI